mmetsp:Transcript_13652/g.36307  ORF Transcript_13652/g.36307 Transcript_13652/m.36307 type:complete len:249 (-) Transcript_13652:575-1321(-)
MGAPTSRHGGGAGGRTALRHEREVAKHRHQGGCTHHHVQVLKSVLQERRTQVVWKVSYGKVLQRRVPAQPLERGTQARLRRRRVSSQAKDEYSTICSSTIKAAFDPGYSCHRGTMQCHQRQGAHARGETSQVEHPRHPMRGKGSINIRRFAAHHSRGAKVVRRRVAHLFLSGVPKSISEHTRIIRRRFGIGEYRHSRDDGYSHTTSHGSIRDHQGWRRHVVVVLRSRQHPHRWGGERLPDGGVGRSRL